jgi:hypothetical protein
VWSGSRAQDHLVARIAERAEGLVRLVCQVDGRDGSHDVLVLQGSAPAGYSRFGDGRPRPLPNREWMIPGSRGIARSREELERHPFVDAAHRRVPSGYVGSRETAFSSSASKSNYSSSRAIHGSSTPLASRRRWIAPRRSPV